MSSTKLPQLVANMKIKKILVLYKSVRTPNGPETWYDYIIKRRLSSKRVQIILRLQSFVELNWPREIVTEIFQNKNLDEMNFKNLFLVPL